LVIPSYSLDVDDVYVFKTPHHPRLRRDGSELMVEVGMATAAAPTFLPVFKLRTRPPGFSTRVISRVHRATRA
jgi:patatin-like phospholipase/acyl hydrolase